eukprot:SAG31_NODE_3590_length_4093_cov_1.985478_2_plen_613_part_00
MALNYIEFKKSLFEMVDLWATGGHKEVAYVAFLEALFDAIVKRGAEVADGAGDPSSWTVGVGGGCRDENQLYQLAPLADIESFVASSSGKFRPVIKKDLAERRKRAGDVEQSPWTGYDVERLCFGAVSSAAVLHRPHAARPEQDAPAGYTSEHTDRKIEVEHAAATKVQAFQRGKLVRRGLPLLSAAAGPEFDTTARNKAQEQSFAKEEDEDLQYQVTADSWFEHSAADEVGAAKKIQALSRGNVARKRLGAQCAAATKVQAAQRGKQGRALAIAQRRRDLDRQSMAAERIQSIQRGNRARNTLSKQHLAATKIQATQRGKCGRTAVEGVDRQRDQVVAAAVELQPTERARQGSAVTTSPVQMYVVRRKAAVQQGFDSQSAPTGQTVEPGETLEALEVLVDETGTKRVRCAGGWLSETSNSGTVFLERIGDEEAQERQRQEAPAQRREARPEPADSCEKDSELGRADLETYFVKHRIAVQQGFDTKSIPTGLTMQPGEQIVALETRLDPDGNRRVRFSGGWLSETSANGTLLLTKNRIDVAHNDDSDRGGGSTTEGGSGSPKNQRSTKSPHVVLVPRGEARFGSVDPKKRMQRRCAYCKPKGISPLGTTQNQ